MNKEQEFFIQILADHINGRKTHVPSDVDWKCISYLSKSHQVDGIVYVQCQNDIPLEYHKSYKDKLYMTQYYYSNRKALYNEVEEALHTKGIRSIEVKGFVVARYYPMPALRTMGDTDLIVHREDMPETIRLMQGLGFQGDDNDRAHDWEGYKGKYLFEIHDWLVQNVEHTTESQRDFFNCFDPYVSENGLDWNFHFLFLLMHLRKHFMNSGVGIRQFMDIAIIISRGPKLDWGWIDQSLKYLELEHFAMACFSLIYSWFGVAAPIAFDRLNNTFTEEVTDKILTNGVFGKDDANNRGNYERNLIIKAQGNLSLNRLLMITKIFFPPYKSMRSYPGCGYVDGKPYLLPIAWIHRGIMYFKKGNTEKLMRVIETGIEDQEKLYRQKEFLEKMGL